MKKRLFAGALALLMIIGLLPVSSMLKKPVEANAAVPGTYSYTVTANVMANDKLGDNGFFIAATKIDSTTKKDDSATCLKFKDNNKKITFKIPENKTAKVIIKWAQSSGGGNVKLSGGSTPSTSGEFDTTSIDGYNDFVVEDLKAGEYSITRDTTTFLLRSITVTLTDSKPYTVTINDEYASETSSKNTYNEGDKITLSAEGVKQGKTFLYWKNSNGIIVASGSENASKPIPVYYSDTYTAVYAKEGAKVDYLTPYGGVLATYYAEDVKNPDFKAPDGPTRYGYTFDGWDTDVETVKTSLADEKDVTVKPKYKNADSNIKITVDTTDFDSIKRESSNITINTEIKASVSSDNFAYWAEVDGNGKILNVLSYNSTYYFLANRDIIVKAITKDAAGDNANANPIITKVDYDTTSKTVIYEYTVPEGYTMNFVGVLASTNKTNLESAKVDSNVPGVYKLGASEAECSDYRTFRYTLTSTGTDTWYIKPILTYLHGTDIDTVYGGVFTME